MSSNYADAGLAGIQTQSFVEVPLFSGESPIVTQSETVAAAAIASADLPAFTVVGRNASGELVKAVYATDATAIKPVGITTAKVLKGATDKKVEIFKGGTFNPAALTWDASYTTDALKRLAFEGSAAPGIFIQAIPTYGASAS